MVSAIHQHECNVQNFPRQVSAVREPWNSRCSSWLFWKGRGTRDQIANIHWITEKTGEYQKNIYFCFIDYAKAFDSVDHNKLWKILKEMWISDHLACLLRNFYAAQEATIRTGHGTTGWFQIRKGVSQGCILSPCLFNICKVHHAKCPAGWSTSWNQDSWRKYQ